MMRDLQRRKELFECKFGVTSKPVTLNSWNYKVILYKRITVKLNTVYTELRIRGCGSIYKVGGHTDA